MMESLGNKPGVRVQFSGKGIAYEALKKYSIQKDYVNIVFTGYYCKNEEISIVDTCDFMNLILPDDKLSRHLISNRFYLALLRRKPMIVSSGSIQAEYVEKYGLGLVVSADSNLYKEIMLYANSFDLVLFEQNCNRLLKEIEVDMEYFEKRIFDSLIL